MADSGSNQVDIFDVRKIRRLVELMNDHDLNEIDLKQRDQRIRLRRGAEPVITTAAPAAAPAQPAATPGPSSSASPAGVDSKAEDANLVEIKSPMIGTFYLAPNPEAAPYVKVGDAVGPETTVCMIEAMKVFNEIPAECSGKIMSVLCGNGDPVEFGQPLFKVDPGK